MLALLEHVGRGAAHHLLVLYGLHDNGGLRDYRLVVGGDALAPEERDNAAGSRLAHLPGELAEGLWDEGDQENPIIGRWPARRRGSSQARRLRPSEVRPILPYNMQDMLTRV